MRKLTILAASVAIAGVVACGNGTDNSTAVGGQTQPTDAAPTEPTPVAEVSVTELMQEAGCQGDLIEPQLYTNEVGRCTLGGHELDVATFDTNDLRDEWVAFVEDLGAHVETGDRWAVSGFDSAVTEAFVEALD
jgi:hypothetical protein